MPATLAAATVTLPEFVRDGSPATVQTEWLLTNGLGGYAMGTVSCTPTRRYHALFIPSLHPPVQREVMLHSLAETVIIAPGTDRERSLHITPYLFAGGTAPPSNPYLIRFTRTPAACTWNFRIGQGADQIDIDKTLHLYREVQAASVSYSIRAAMDIVRLQLRPLLRMQDAHSLLHATPDADFRADSSHRHVKVQRGWRTLDLACDSGWFEAGTQWWYNFAYEHERDRGYDWTEDLWSPGAFNLQLRPATAGTITVTAWTGQPPSSTEESRSAATDRLVAIVKETCTSVPKSEAPTIAKLAAAADDFVVRRTGEGAGTSIIAGYPWFSDWGRDSMISCCGLLLTTRRFEEARSVLGTFAAHRRNGLIPNLFNDQTGEAEYNTADASLWFLHAACEYLRTSEDMEAFETLLKPACLDIIDAYREGTEFGIRVDPIDGLVMAGDATTQLTWMDAKRDGVVFTPRHGKPVELSALWYSGVLGVAAAIKRFQSARAAELDKAARRTADHLRVLFWNQARSCLHDVLEPGPNKTWKPVDQVRPNQVFAASLPRSALEQGQQKAVVSAIRASLVTPRGLRTLDPSDAAYRGRYRGPMFERDSAYHNGTTWPWLLGPYAEAVMRSGGFSAKSRTEARGVLAPLIEQMDVCCPGHLAEVYDGDDTSDQPAKPGGCPAQAWSIAETLRVWVLSYEKSE
jgi:predicted glycogen debranching enzyme